MLNTLSDNPIYSIRIKGQLSLIDRPLIMGIINITDDSFYSGSRASSVSDVLQKAANMLQDGADILDLGAMSSRPGAAVSDSKHELEKLLPAIQAIVRKFPDAVLSVDTIHHNVAAACLDAGAAMINDISAGTYDPVMAKTVAEHKAPFIAMHMPGTPETMQQNAVYEDVASEVVRYLAERKKHLLRAGIHDVIVDPGFGFGKTIEHNFELLANLRAFSNLLDSPVLVGISRKSMIWKTLAIAPEDALHGTMVLNTLALEQGAHILRVHDVKEAGYLVKLWLEYRNKYGQ